MGIFLSNSQKKCGNCIHAKKTHPNIYGEYFYLICEIGLAMPNSEYVTAITSACSCFKAK